MLDLPLVAAGPDAPWHLSVDGMSPRGPNLSHWPGNRTPARWKADLSTGICLRFVRAGRDEQRAFLDGAKAVLNDHYDTDGFLSLLAILRPEVALAREELCLAAAATGDFQTYSTWRAFAIDRIVKHVGDPERSPVGAEFDAVDGPARDHARYLWLIDHAESVLDRPQRFAPLYETELARIEAELASVRDGALVRRCHAPAALAVLEGSADFHRVTLNTASGCVRVLHVRHAPEGRLYRYHDRTESWFEMFTIRPPPRVDLEPLRAQLQQLEGDGLGAWCCDPPESPIPELYHGLPASQEYGAVTRTLLPSRLAPEQIERTFAEYLTLRPA
jgi:hypothetical protein